MTLVHRVEMNGMDMDMDWWMQEKLGNHQKQKTPPVVESVRIIHDNGSAEDLNMSFYYDSGEYVVNVTAVDRTGLNGYIYDLGESREVLGDEDMSTPEYPTVWNTGNRI